MEAGALTGGYLSVGTVVLLWGLAIRRPPLGPSEAGDYDKGERQFRSGDGGSGAREDV